MSYRTTLNTKLVIDGKSYPSVIVADTDGVLKKEVSVPPAKTGTLSTRTDADTGTLTMAGGHGITTGARLDLYWSGGARRGITVGTVATNSVPFDGGVGDDLPIATTAITAMVPHEEEFVVTGDNVQSLGLYANQSGQIVIAESDDSEIFGTTVGGANGTNQSYAWVVGNGTSPVAGEAIAKVFFSHGNSSQSATMGIGAGVN